jgi:preprotein translocase subunit SecE
LIRRFSRPPQDTDGTNMAKTAGASKPNVFKRLGKYFTDVRAEMRRVVWPGRTEVINSSVVVIVTLLFFTLFTFVVDAVVVVIVDAIASLGG